MKDAIRCALSMVLALSMATSPLTPAGAALAQEWRDAAGMAGEGVGHEVPEPTADGSEDPQGGGAGTVYGGADDDTPAFDAWCEIDGVRIAVKAEGGAFPASAELRVEAATRRQERLAEEAVGEVRGEGENVAVSRTYDVKAIDSSTGEDLQPVDGHTIEVSFTMAGVGDENLTASVYHVPDAGAAEELPCEACGDTVVVESDGFSLYTVELTYGDLQYVLEGGSSVPLADVLSAVGLAGEAESAASSDPGLFSVSRDAEGRLFVSSHAPFSSDERLWVTINGTEYEVAVTDTQGTLSGTGTSQDPFIISDADDWATFASNVNAGTDADKCYRLSDAFDSSASPVTATVGTSEHPFTGTLDGNHRALTVALVATGEYCAPFCHAEGAAFRDLTVAGTVSTGNKYAAGLVAQASGATTIERCVSAVAIASTVEGDGTHGGFVGKLNGGGTIGFTGCVFSGSITGDSTTKCAGFVGWNGGSSIFYDGCLQRGTLGLKQEDGSATFNRNGGNSFASTCYLSSSKYGTTEEDAICLYESAPDGLLCGPHTAADGVSYYAGLSVGGVDELYVLTGDAIRPEPVVTDVEGEVLVRDSDYSVAWSGDGKSCGTYTVTVTGISPYGGSKVLSYDVKDTETLGGHEFRLGEDDGGLYYAVGTADDLRAIATYVNASKYNTCSGMRFVQTAEIDLGNSWVPIGKHALDKWFSGTYDGGGYAINKLKVEKESDDVGLFGAIKGATIRRVTLVDAKITTSGDNAGGIVGNSGGGDTVDGCAVRNCAISGVRFVGGIVGYAQAAGGTVIKGCTVSGGIVSGNYDSGALIGTSAIGDGTGVVGCVAERVKSGESSYHTSLVGYNEDNSTTFTHSYCVDSPDTHAITLGDGVELADVEGWPGVRQPPFGKKGETISVTAQTSEGYAIVSVRAASGRAVKVTWNGSVHTFKMPDSDVSVAETIDQGNLVVSEDGNVYTILTVAGWNVFCDLLGNSDSGLSGKTVCLGADVGTPLKPVKRMVGDSRHRFNGEFDGRGHALRVAYGTATEPVGDYFSAPFRYVNGNASIHDLVVAGDIYTSIDRSAGLVGSSSGTTTISDCRVSVAIHSSVGDKGYHGGIVSDRGSTNNDKLTIEGCVFDGGMFTTAGTTACGGLVARGGGTLTITDCLYAPAGVALAEDEAPIDDGATIARVWSSGTPENTYYTKTLGTAQGKQSRAVTAGDHVTVALAGTATAYDTSGITSYGTGMEYQGAVYAGDGDEVKLALGHGVRVGYAFGGYVARDAEQHTLTLTEGDGCHTLTVPDGDVMVTADWTEDPGAPVAQVLGHTLTLEGTIGVNTYLLLGEEVLGRPSDFRVEFWRDGVLTKETGVAEVSAVPREVGGVSYQAYPFTVTAVAKEMDTKYTMKIRGPQGYVDFANSDGETVAGATGLPYAITDYLQDRIEHSTNTNMKTLARDMAAYGAYAKHYFAVRDQHSTEPLPEIAGFQAVTAADLAAYAYTGPTDIDHFTYRGTTLVLEDQTSFRLYFQSDDPGALTISYRKAGEGQYETMEVKQGQGAYAAYRYVEVPNIVAKELDVMYDFTISNGTGSTTAHHGPLGYALWAVQSSGKEHLRYAMMALYRYSQSAKAYFAG